MQARYFDEEKDYDQVVKWWGSWGWPAMPLAFLSKTGIVISKDGVDLCAGWLYQTDSAICWAENYIANKEAPRELRKGSIEFLIEELMSEAKVNGFKMVASSIRHKGLIRKLLSAGFTEDDKNMSNLSRVL